MFVVALSYPTPLLADFKMCENYICTNFILTEILSLTKNDIGRDALSD